jgi:hypothetical protein
VYLGLEADYSVTHDYVLYGVITGAEVSDDAPELVKQLATLTDQPFSVRYRLDGDVLTVKDVKFADLRAEDAELRLLVGRYRRVVSAERPRPEPVEPSPRPTRRRPAPAAQLTPAPPLVEPAAPGAVVAPYVPAPVVSPAEPRSRRSFRQNPSQPIPPANDPSVLPPPAVPAPQPGVPAPPSQSVG